MITDTLAELFERDLLKAAAEIEKYVTEEDLWAVREGIGNSGGNLGLHLTGNIKHFFGAVLGGTGYVRDRDAEFSSGRISVDQVAGGLREAAEVATKVLRAMAPEDLAEDYPEQFAGRTVSKGWMVTHLLTHLNYHLGQINYHRRLTG